MANLNPNEATRFQPGNDVGQQFQEGNTDSLKHGVSAAIKDLAAGRPLRGDLATVQHRLTRQIETHEGRIDAQQWLASGLLAVAQGLMAVIQDAMANDERDKAMSYASQFGSIANRAGSAIKLLGEMQQVKGGDNVLESAIKAAGQVLDGTS